MFEKLKENVLKIKESINNDNVTIVCASKYFDTNTMRDLYYLGITHFGESRTVDLLKKKKELKDLNITWHFIGNLQSNKVKEIINEISYLHSLERVSLLKEIEKHRNKPLNTFIQLNLASEDTKSGLSEDNLQNFIHIVKKYDKIKPIGLMQMGVYDNIELTKEIYQKAALLNKEYGFTELSMGMSDDYLDAVSSGSTFVRIGSLFIK